MATVTGTSKPQTQSLRYSFDHRTGWSKEITVEGLKSNVLYQAKKYAQFAKSVDYVTEGPTARLTARIDSDDMSPVNNLPQASTTWEILGQQSQRHIAENPRVSNGVSARDIATIKRHVDAILSGAITVANALAETTVDSVSYAFEGTSSYGTGTLTTHEKKLRILLYKYLANQETILSSEYVLRKNQTVATNYDLKMSTAGVDNVWTLAALIKGENVPPQISATMSGAARSSYDHDNGTNDILKGTDAKWNFGFLKQAPQISYTVGGQTERSQEWWLNYWLSTDYPLY